MVQQAIIAQQRRSITVFLDESEKKCPRIFNVIVVIIGLFVLIGISMLCGHFLASLEREGELDDVHSSMVSFIEGQGAIKELVNATTTIYDDCLDSYLNNATVLNGTELKEFVKNCRADGMEEVNTKVAKMDRATGGEIIGAITLNWNRCLQSKDFDVPAYAQGYSLGLKWIEYFQNGMAEGKSYENTLETARSKMNEVCTVNSSGGAMFWFTIMTTIGYGNTAPVTDGGRWLVITAGFLTMIIFTALIGGTGYIMLAIFDDFFSNFGMKVLTKGWIASLFWFVILALWCVGLAGVRALYTETRYDGDSDESFFDRFWWACISITTIGFGDFYIPHQTFAPYDMLYIPLIMLLGFVVFANFVIKTVEVIAEFAEKSGIIDDDSLGELIRASRRNLNVEYTDDPEEKEESSEDKRVEESK